MAVITGGAGFVGRFTARLWARSELQVVEFDNLATGKSGQARWGSFHIDDIRHVDPLVYIIRPRGVETVVHLAAAVHSGESVANPSACYSNHVSGTLALSGATVHFAKIEDEPYGQ